MNEYNPQTLPQVTSVEVVDLRQIDANRENEYMENAADAPSVKCSDKPAKYIAKIWRGLPSGQKIRCHMPPVGIRFFDGDSIVCEASVCWKCENIFGVQQGIPIAYCFDPNSTVGYELYLTLKGVIGNDVLADK